jgi:hypothetical protein
MESRDHTELAKRWLEGALKQYGGAEPRSGLEARILANVRTEKMRIDDRWGLLTLATVAGLLLAGTVFLLRPRGTTREITTGPSPSPVQVSPLTSAVPPIAHAVSGLVDRKPARRTTASQKKEATVPRLDQFPSPLPLSEQDLPLLLYLRRAHREVKGEGSSQLVADLNFDVSESSWTPASIPSVDLNLRQPSILSPDELAGVSRLVVRNSN